MNTTRQAKADNIKIRQNWIEEEVESCADELCVDQDVAFLLLSASLLLQCAPNDIEPEDIVDGGEDKQIDFIHIEDNSDKGHADITFLQTKNSRSFSSNIVVRIQSGLEWVFQVPKKDLDSINNNSLKTKIEAIRQLRRQYGAANISIKFFHITLGDKSKLSKEYLDEAKKLREKYTNLGFGYFIFEQVGANELVDLINKDEVSKRKIDISIPIQYDKNRPSLLQYSLGDTKSIVCTVSGVDLAVAASEEPRDAIFDLNVRPYYGSTGKVNRDILDTCISTDAAQFWFLNNGVTLVCDDFDLTHDPDTERVRIKNAQIVNGCQTTVTLREAYEKGLLSANVSVLLRIYSTGDPLLVEKITLTTNNQNRITDRDLRANDPVQQDIERRMLDDYKYFYERKNKQHKSKLGLDKQKIIPSPKAAQAYLAIVRAKPSNARRHLNQIWSEFYNEIFDNVSVVDLIVAYKIYQFAIIRLLKQVSQT